MQKVKLTRNDVKRNWYYVLECGYCRLQTFLKYDRAVAYNCGVYGWNYDVYELDLNRIALTTGYRGTFSQNAKELDYDFLNKYEGKAREIYYNNSLTWKQQERKIKNLKKKFIQEIEQNYLEERHKL